MINFDEITRENIESMIQIDQKISEHPFRI